MTQTIRERLALADEANRRACSQRLLRAGQEQSPEEVDERRRNLVESFQRTMKDANESDREALRSVQMLGGVIVAIVFVLLCAVAGIAAEDWWTGGAAFVASVPLECAR